MKQPLSISIISKNEEHIISDLLECVCDFASEIIIVDSGSTDKTIEIAKSFGAKIFSEEWKGFAEQKNSALEKCTNEWILALDCDEIPSLELMNRISEIISKNEIDGCFINRRSIYLGKTMKYAWQPDWNLRLVKKSKNPKWEGDFIHEKLVTDGVTKKIQGEILHYSYRNLSHHFQKTIDYAQKSALAYYSKGKRFTILNLLLNPINAFLKIYFLNLGMLDGIRGFIAAFSSFLGTFMKYIFLYEIKGNEKNKNYK